MDFSEITDRLLIGKTPKPEHYPWLVELGVRLVINMRIERRPFNNTGNQPLDFLWLPAIDSPLFPIPMGLLQRGVRAGLKAIEHGGKVFVHCAGGVHRSAAMGACILIGQGYSSYEAMRVIKQRRSIADPEIWYIRRRIVKFADAWGNNQKQIT